MNLVLLPRLLVVHRDAFVFTPLLTCLVHMVVKFSVQYKQRTYLVALNLWHSFSTRLSDWRSFWIKDNKYLSYSKKRKKDWMGYREALSKMSLTRISPPGEGWKEPRKHFPVKIHVRRPRFPGRSEDGLIYLMIYISICNYDYYGRKANYYTNSSCKSSYLMMFLKGSSSVPQSGSDKRLITSGRIL